MILCPGEMGPGNASDLVEEIRSRSPRENFHLSSDVHLILLHHFLIFPPKKIINKISPKLTLSHGSLHVLPCSPQISSKIGKSPGMITGSLDQSRGQSSEGLQAHLSSEAQRDGDHRAEVHHRRLLLVLLGASLGRNHTKSMNIYGQIYGI